jgi:GT2 family glycosyltransferase
VLPTAPTATGYARPEDLASLLDEPASCDATVVLLADDHPDDLVRCVTALDADRSTASRELIVVANDPTFDVRGVVPDDSVVLMTTARLGWADAANLGMRRSRGSVVVLMDTSLEAGDGFLDGLLAAFEDDRVGIAGPFGLVTDDGRHFEESVAGPVHAVEGYCLALRREALRVVGGFDPHFRYYRNADIDLSFAVRDAGWLATVVELPVRRHEHRGWSDLADDERERLSKRNFYRFLKHWGDRRDLLTLGRG